MSEPSSIAKRRYRAPALVRYGRLRGLTAGVSGTLTDGMSGMTSEAPGTKGMGAMAVQKGGPLGA